MNWLAKINLNIVVQRLGPFRSALLLGLLISVCLFCGYRIGNFFHTYQVSTLEQQKERLSKLYNEQESLQRRVNTLEVELEVERMANKQAQSLLKEMEQEHYSVKKDLAFYEKVMAPEKQADGLVIDSFKVFPTQSANHYRFQFTLVQQKLKKRYAKGYIEFDFVGSLEGKPTALALDKVSSITKQQRSFSFQYFQIIEGEFTLPEGYKVDQIKASAILPKSRWQKYYRLNKSYSWNSALSDQA